jgi:hypothetical protein
MHQVLFSQPNSFLAIMLQLSIPKTRLNSIPLLPSSYPGRLASRNSTRLFSSEHSFLTTFKGSRRKHCVSIVGKTRLQRRCIATKLLDCCLRICCHGNVFTQSMPSNEHLFWLHYYGFRASCHSIINTHSTVTADWNKRLRSRLWPFAYCINTRDFVAMTTQICIISELSFAVKNLYIYKD